MSFFERLKTEASAEWRAYTEHPFTNGLADGSLAEAAFRHYLVQDYLFLTEFARAYALSVYKSPKLADMRATRKAPIPASRLLSGKLSEAARQKKRSRSMKALRRHFMKIGSGCGKNVSDGRQRRGPDLFPPPNSPTAPPPRTSQFLPGYRQHTHR